MPERGQIEAERGLFVTFEGGEGAGKSTQIALLRDRLAGLGLDVVSTREPGGSPRAEAIRGFLLAGGAREFGPLAEAMLFAAARADHVAVTIGPALARGAVVLCDRFADSTRVYQGALGQVPGESVRLLELLATGELRPDLTLVLDLPAELGLARAEARRSGLAQAPDRFEEQGLAYHEGIRRAFLAIAEAEADRCAVIDATGPPRSVADSIWRAASERLALARPGTRHAG